MVHSKEISTSDLEFAKAMQEKLGARTEEILLSLKTCWPEKTLSQMEAVAKASEKDISAAIKDFKESNSQAEYATL